MYSVGSASAPSESRMQQCDMLIEIRDPAKAETTVVTKICNDLHIGWTHVTLGCEVYATGDCGIVSQEAHKRL